MRLPTILIVVFIVLFGVFGFSLGRFLTIKDQQSTQEIVEQEEEVSEESVDWDDLSEEELQGLIEKASPDGNLPPGLKEYESFLDPVKGVATFKKGRERERIRFSMRLLIAQDHYAILEFSDRESEEIFEYHVLRHNPSGRYYSCWILSGDREFKDLYRGSNGRGAGRTSSAFGLYQQQNIYAAGELEWLHIRSSIYPRPHYLNIAKISTERARMSRWYRWIWQSDTVSSNGLVEERELKVFSINPTYEKENFERLEEDLLRKERRERKRITETLNLGS